MGQGEAVLKQLAAMGAAIKFAATLGFSTGLIIGTAFGRFTRGD
jgi:hypothetical protein